MDAVEKDAGAHAILGAGLCGLAVAAALRRRQIPFVVYEAGADLGGNWRDATYEGVRLVSSARTTAFPDLPMPPEVPTFPDHHQMLAYLERYADHHQLRPHIRFASPVRRARALGAGRQARWQVELATGARHTHAGLIVATGQHRHRRWPAIPGLCDLPHLHARDYRSPARLSGQRVLVLGLGNSACDIAVDAARHGSAAHISARQGRWIVPRSVGARPFVELCALPLPRALQRAMVRSISAIFVGDYRDHGLPRPDHRPLELPPTINGALLGALRSGSVVAHPQVERFTGSTAHFVDGTRTEVDLVVAATGYHLRFPFLDEGILAWEGEVPQLVAGMSPELANFYVFGLGRAPYGAGPIAGRGARALAAAIEAQRGLDRPLGQLLWQLGLRPPRTLTADPLRAMVSLELACRLLPALPRLAPHPNPGAATP